jgi:O-antigen/teichoic acid export membrane protein
VEKKQLMEIKISKKDVVWGYIAQFFSIASGIIVLPLILRMLSSEEIGMNYLMLTIGSMVALFDFGFAPQFGRNITYVFSGVDEIKKEGIEIVSDKKEINYHLLATMIHTAKFVYRRLGLIVLIVMLTLGSLYIYRVTNGFETIKNSFFIWIVYSVSIYFNIYYSYYTSLLTGKGLIMESKKAMVYSKITYIILASILLFSGIGLLGVVLANLIAPFVNRLISHHYFFTKELISNINQFIITPKEKIELFKIIWHNAKKLGLISIASSVLTHLSIFIIGLFWTLEKVASYGLMLQLVGIITTISTTFFYISFPKMNNFYIQNKTDKMIQLFSLSLLIYYALFLIGSTGLLIIPYLLHMIKSNVFLPQNIILIIFSLFSFLGINQAIFSQMLLLENKVPFMKASIITASFIFIGTILALKIGTGIIGIILAQGIPVLCYSAWKWPMEVKKKFDINSLYIILKLGLLELKKHI